MGTRALRFGRLGSTTLRAHPSLLVAGVVLVALFAPRFDHAGADPYLVGVVFVVALYASILVHELAHVGAARAFGMRVPSVTLHLLGGETHIVGRSRGPGADALIAFVGPVASAAIGVVVLLAVDASAHPTTQQVLWSLGWINLLIAAFNLLPGPPLDGGRVVAAAAWSLSGRHSTGLRVAAWTGRATALLAVAGVVWFSLGSPRGLFDVLITVVVGGFLWAGAGHSLRQADAEHSHDNERNT
ncbi:M50 family metallopeptidase [Aeromicrobium sp. CTD01-1L150]|uniref:M50 family metallopeptidase n=1 Tax=Aeromicrobium sp. CTD01-1L150 TaxID=3341830 RepID=UPI0035C21CBE